jgi:hypothetical protein
VAPVKTLCEKLIKIDILLTHVKLNKLIIVTPPLKQKTTFHKNKKTKPTRIGKTESRPV